MKFTNRSKAMLYNINRVIKHVSNIQFDNFVTYMKRRWIGNVDGICSTCV